MLILNRAQFQAFNLYFLFKAFKMFIILMIQQNCAFIMHFSSVLHSTFMNHTVSFMFYNFNQQHFSVNSFFNAALN